MKRTQSRASQLLEIGVMILPILLIVGFVLNGFLTEPVLAIGLEEVEIIERNSMADSDPVRSAIGQPENQIFQISVIPTPTKTPTPVPPTNTPTIIPPTNTPTIIPPTNTPTPVRPTNTPTIIPPTNTPTPVPPTNTPTIIPPTNTPTPTSTPIPNRPPEIITLNVPMDPVDINQQPIQVEATYTDPDTGDTHTASWSWGDTSGSMCPPNNVDCSIDQISDIVMGHHMYSEPGVYQVMLTVTDDGGLSDTAVSDFIVVYDPSGGFVTGGGWINSEPGWCQLDLACAAAGGKANFGFVSKYKKGSSAPTGNTEFNFQAGHLNFQSTTYQWLVVNQGGSNAMFKGTGTINGENAPGDVPYTFIVWATDDYPDTFRIKISYDTPGGEVVVYDNGFNQPLGGGSIVVHKGK